MPAARHESWVLPNDGRSVGRARRAVGESLAHASDEVRDVATLLTSELVTNAVTFSHDDVHVSLELTARGIRVAVTDTGPGRPAIAPEDPQGEHGRGLRIVDSLADSWGVEGAAGGTGEGKTVWFTVPGR